MFKKLLTLLLVIVIMVSVSPISAVEPQSNGVTFLEAFPDSHFRAFVLNGLEHINSIDREETDKISDTDKNIMANQVPIIIANNLYIADLTGIEYFIGLEILFVNHNYLTTLDISANINLRELYAINNRLTNIDVSNNLLLSTLWIRDNFMNFNYHSSIFGWEKTLLHRPWPIDAGGFIFFPQYTPDRRWSINPSIMFIAQRGLIMIEPGYLQKDCVLVVSFFRNGRFMGFDYIEFEVGMDIFSLEFPRDFSIGPEWIFRIFAWDNKQDMNPIGEVVEIDFFNYLQ